MTGIYSITCIRTGQVYVGQSTDIRVRLWSHRNQLRRGRHANKLLQSAFDRHGEISFDFTILWQVRKKRPVPDFAMGPWLDRLERYFLLKFPNSFNKMPITIRVRETAEGREAISILISGQRRDDGDPVEISSGLMLSHEDHRESKTIVRETIRELSPRDRFVIEQVFGFDSHPITKSAVSRILNVSPERVRQIEKKSLVILKTKLEKSWQRKC